MQPLTTRGPIQASDVVLPRTVRIMTATQLSVWLRTAVTTIEAKAVEPVVTFYIGVDGATMLGMGVRARARPPPLCR